MKDFVFFIIIIISIYSLSIINTIDRYNQHEETIQRFNQLDSTMTHRSQLDSIYWNHLENCAFVNKDSIGIGYQGYLYDKYHRKYIKK